MFEQLPITIPINPTFSITKADLPWMAFFFSRFVNGC